MAIRDFDRGTHGYPSRITVDSPIKRRDLAALPNDACVVQFDSPLPDKDHQLLGGWMGNHPQATLRAWAKLPATLDFLRHYPDLNGLTLDCSGARVEDLSGLDYLPATLDNLVLDIKLPSPAELNRLGRFKQLRSLRLGGIRRIPDAIHGLPITELSLGDAKSLDGIGNVPSIESLRLNSVTADLSPLQDLPRLTHLTLALGGCRDLHPLVKVQSLRHFEAWLVLGLEDLEPLTHLEHLQTLHLERMRQITRLPPLTGMRELTKIDIALLSGLHDLTPLRDAPALVELDLSEMQHLQAEEVIVALKDHPTIKTLGVGLGSARKNRAVRDALRIPGNYGGFTWSAENGAGDPNW